MTDLLIVVPDLDTRAFSHIIPSLEKSAITTADLLTIDATDVGKRARVPIEEVRKLVDVLLQHLKSGESCRQSSEPQVTISLLDDKLDAALQGGIYTGFVTEIAGESAVGKTQHLLTLLLAVQLPAPRGLGKNALYISTEAQLSTKRLAQILEHHPKLGVGASLDRVHSTHVRDLEAQEHILRYQVPVFIERNNIGLVVIDSIAANYRAEIDRSNDRRAAQSVAERSLQIGRIGAHLRALAHTRNVAIVVANQVADRFESNGSAFLSQSTQRSRPQTPPRVTSNSIQHQSADPLDLNDDQPLTFVSLDSPLDLDHQQRFYTGWGDEPEVTALKNPSLGLTWTCQLATRVVLTKAPLYADTTSLAEEKVLSGWVRTFKVVFSAWTESSKIDFEIWQGGIRTTAAVEDAKADTTR